MIVYISMFIIMISSLLIYAAEAYEEVTRLARD